MTKKTKQVKHRNTATVERTVQQILSDKDFTFAAVPLLVYEDEIGPIMLYPSVRELMEEADIVYPDEAITDAMEVGKLYDWGVANIYEDFHAFCWIVKVGVDFTHLFTTDEEPDNEHTACLVIPHDKLLEWTRTEPKETI